MWVLRNVIDISFLVICIFVFSNIFLGAFPCATFDYA